MSDIYPLVVVLDDKFDGVYSGGKWTAWNKCYVPSKIFGDAKECADFFSTTNLIYGRGETPQEAIDDLKMILDCGISDPDEKDEDEEEEHMEPTSVWEIDDIDKIWITQDGNEISLLLKNRDDLTKIILTGDAIKKHNDEFVTILKGDIEECNKITKEIEKKMYKLEEKNKMLEIEKKELKKKYINKNEELSTLKLNTPITDTMLADDYLKLSRENEKIKKQLNAVQLMLENFKKDHADIMKTSREKHKDEVEQLKAKIKDISDDNALLLETNKKLKHADMLDKEAADYWSKEHDTLLERFRKLQEENKKLKDKLENVEPFRALERTIREKHELKKELALEKAANEAQRRFITLYAGKGTEVQFNYAIDETGEVSYVIVEKERYQDLKDNGYRAMINGEIYTMDQLVNMVLELTALKTPTLENFADEKPSTRADILDQAKKCVCGQREQDYGTPESNFQLIADLWNGYLGEKTDNPVISVTPVDVSMMMALMKIARIRNGGGSGDSFVDLAGYAACGGEIWHGQNHKDQN